MKRILVSGSSGFVGEYFCSSRKSTYDIRTISLRNTPLGNTDFSNVNSVLHLAGIAHRMEKTEDQIYYDVNHKLTLGFALRCKEAGVEHFVFMSTIKVYGDSNELLTLETPCVPNDAYGKSKLLAETELMRLSDQNFKVAIIRPPLIYGPEVKGNLKRLKEWVDSRSIIPLGGIKNKRSIVGIENLISLIDKIIERRAEGIFLIQDKAPISTTELIESIAKVKGSKIRLIKIPAFLRTILKLIKPDIHKRLFGTLIVDDSQTKIELNFEHPYTTEQGLRLMINSKDDK
ncbi:MAG TPA: NAD-dependent epimerase/dehydratase family protein [Roseivirga sp.]